MYSISIIIISSIIRPGSSQGPARPLAAPEVQLVLLLLTIIAIS